MIDTKVMMARVGYAMRLKDKMVEKGLDKARCKCKFCDGMVSARLSPNRRGKHGKHIQLRCNTCDFMLIE